MNNLSDNKKLKEIIDSVSTLPIENQEYILATIRGMIFTRNYLLNKENIKENKKED